MGKEETDQGSAPGVDWTLENVIEYVGSCYDRDTILDVLMGYSGHWFPARMVLIVGREWVQLFATASFDLPKDLPRAARRATVEEGSPATTDETATGTAHEVGLGLLFDQLDLGAPLIRTLGVKIGARVAIVLAGVIHDEHVDTEPLEAAAVAAGRQLEDVIRMAKSDELPPAGQRIPPFPTTEQEKAPEPKKKKKQKRKRKKKKKSGRTTQNLEVGFGDDSPSSPRITLTAPREEKDDAAQNEDEEVSSNATSFGLGFVGAVPPGRVVDEEEGEDSEETSEAASKPSEAEEPEAEAPGEDSASEADEEHPETMIGSPFIEDKFPGEIDEPEEIEEFPSEDSDVIELTERSVAGVKVMAPTDVSPSDPNRTQLGGLSASVELLRGNLGQASSAASEVSESGPGTVIGQPKAVSEAHATQLGGVLGEEAAVSGALGRVASEAIEAAISEALGEASPAKPPRQTGEWSTARTKSGVPTAMILKRARRKKGSSAKRSAPETKATTPANPEPPKAPTKPRKAPTKPKDDPGRSSPTPVAVGPVGPESKEMLDISSPLDGETGRTSFGGWKAEESRTRKFEADVEVDDAWFDYFADEAENTGDNPETALNFSLSEPSDDPHTIPPETLERLLDSGPQMVDMQEEFMTLDSRDRDKAFEAADAVAALGERAIEVLDLMFPGRVFLDRYQYGDDIPPVDQHGPVLHALVRLGDLALPVALAHLTDSSNEARFYAVHLLTMLDAEPILPELFDRLFDRDQQTRRIAAELMLQYQSAASFDQDLRRKIREELLAGDDVHVTVAATLLARLRDTKGVEALIDAMDDSATPRVKLAVLGALTEITLHHWSSPYEWRQWWESAKDEKREQWIVEALDAATSELREQAHEEVQRIPGLELNYHPEQPGKLRKRAQKELSEWFAKAKG